MRAILIPVKEFAEAKKRLAAHFSATERAELARALCRDFFAMMAGVRLVARIVVISKEPEALGLARKTGWETIVESEQSSESASVDFASRQCATQGINALLRVPIDLPLAEPEDIEGLFDHLDAAPAVVIVPSGDGTGTNALLRTPPELFPSCFGPNSFSLHLAEAESRGIRACVVRNPRLAQDIDEIEDLQRLAGMLRPGSETARWFSQHASRLTDQFRATVSGASGSSRS
jgi:2-phospho-L-lactate/phosphoenolpyruvate guanylyltransferase